MPDMDGWELARRLREHRGLGGALLVDISENGQAEAGRDTRPAGCDLHLSKPIDPEQIRRLLTLRESEWTS